ncbi:MAG: LCP family protein [Actinomycetota bacterium]|nr:LCP family protein [Actinomycetota bacterium]
MPRGPADGLSEAAEPVDPDAGGHSDRPAGSSAPPAPRRPRAGRHAAPRFRRVLGWVALGTVVVVLVGAGTLYGAFRHYGGKVETVDGLPRLADGPDAGDEQHARSENFLVVGSDTADGLTREQLRAVNTSRKGRDGTRTDTVLLVQVPADGSRARVVSFPRDSWVPVPGHSMAKINGAYDLGEKTRPGSGPSTLVATVERLTGLQVDHYVEVSLYAFVRITDALGGVEVCLSAPAVETKARIDLPAGRQRLDGRQALAFVRQRNGLPGGDLGRIRRQQYFLSAASRQVLRAGTLLNPVALDRLLDAVTSSVRVDPGTDEGDLLRLALRMRRVAAGAIRFETVPVLDADARVAGLSVVLLDTSALPAFFAGRPPARPAPTPPLTVPPSSIGVVLENGTHRPGLARTASSAFSGAGFRVLGLRDAARSDHAQTRVRYGAQRADSARTLAAALPGSLLVPDATVGPRGLVVTLGATYAGVRRVAVQPAAAGGRGPAGRPRTAADADCIA